MALLISRFRSRGRRTVRTFVVACALLAFVATAEGAEATVPPTLSAEYQLKVAYLFKLPQFVEWPTQTLGAPQTPFVLGVLGDDPFGAYLDDFVRGETVGTHPIVVQRYRQPEEVQNCQVLFVARSELPKLEHIFEILKGRSTLTVGDGDNFARRGGMVRFAIEGNKIHFSINPDAAKAADLTISSKLLRLATIVTSPNR